MWRERGIMEDGTVFFLVVVVLLCAAPPFPSPVFGSVHLMEMPPRMWILGGCLWQYFSFLRALFLKRDFLRWYSSCTVHSSVKITFWNCSSSSRCRFTQSILSCLFASLMAWQYLAVHGGMSSPNHSVLLKLSSLCITLSSPNLSRRTLHQLRIW